MASIGFIGSGNVGQAIARRVIAAGHTVVMSNSRGPKRSRDSSRRSDRRHVPQRRLRQATRPTSSSWRSPSAPSRACPSGHWPAKDHHRHRQLLSRRETDTLPKSTTDNNIERDARQPPTHLEGRQGVQHDHRRSDRPTRHPSRHTSPPRAADRRRRHLCQARRHPPHRRDRIRRRRRRPTGRRSATGPQRRRGPVLDTEESAGRSASIGT